MSKRKKALSVFLSAAVVLTVAAAVALLLQFRSTAEIPPSGNPAPVPTEGGSEYQHAVVQARQILIPLLDRYPAIAVAVGVDETLAWSEAFGYSDITQMIAASTETRFRAYSVAKPLTGVAVLRLHQDGRIDLDAPVGRYLSGLPAEIGTVTIRQLAGHLSGIRDYRKGEWLSLSTGACSTPSEAMEAFSRDPLEERPGSAYSYSSFNYVVLSALIEAVSGKSFETYMEESILDPADMHATTYGNFRESAPLVSVFYEPARFGRVRTARTIDNTCKFGAGALVTTVQDLVGFGNALLAGVLLDPEHVDAAFTSMKTDAGEETRYSFGWGVGVDSAGTRYVAHSGGAIGGRSALLLYPDERVTVAILASIENEQLTDEAQQIGRLFVSLRRNAGKQLE